MTFKTWLKCGALVFFGLVLLAGYREFWGPSNQIGSVSTTFRWLGANDKINVEAIADPSLPVVCYMGRAVTGGIKGTMGVAEDPSLMSISCIATGPIDPSVNLDRLNGQTISSDRANMWFKTITITRLTDPKQKVAIYVATSTHIIDGSPFNATSAVRLN